MNILVAEDDKVLSAMMCGVLRDGGHVCVPAFDAMQALMYVMKSPPMSCCSTSTCRAVPV